MMTTTVSSSTSVIPRICRATPGFEPRTHRAALGGLGAFGANCAVGCSTSSIPPSTTPLAALKPFTHHTRLFIRPLPASQMPAARRLRRERGAGRAA
jgi:hypothetical protein